MFLLAGSVDYAVLMLSQQFQAIWEISPLRDMTSLSSFLVMNGEISQMA